MFKPNYAADILYPTIRNRGRRSRIWSTLTRRSCCLLDLAQVERTCRVSARHAVGVQTVRIDQVQGSGGRSNDFDQSFNPLKSHNRERWLHIAEAQQRGTALPLVQLIQVGNIYFVSDGHHRISVARALGQREMEAQVTVWQVEGRLPWERSTAHRDRLNLKQLSTIMWASGRKLQEQVRLSLANLLINTGLKLKPG